MVLPNWIIVLAAIELIGFLFLGLGIATAIPEEWIVGRSSPELERDQAIQPKAA